MPNTSELSVYLKPENVQDGDVIEFLDAGKIVDKTFKQNGEEQKRKALEVTVSFRGEQKMYTPNGTTVKLLSSAWGPETDGWIGRKAVLTVVPSSSGKDMIIAKPKA